MDWVHNEFGSEYSENRVYESKVKNTQEAHEGIRPTSVKMINLNNNENDLESKIYNIIWKRAIASQMSNAVYGVHTTQINPTARSTKEFFVHKRTKINFEGYTKVYDIQDTNEDNDNDEEDDDDGDNDDINADIDITNMVVGDKVAVTLVNCTEKARKAPSRYNEGSLIKMMEKIGIGRPRY